MKTLQTQAIRGILCCVRPLSKGVFFCGLRETTQRISGLLTESCKARRAAKGLLSCFCPSDSVKTNFVNAFLIL